MSTEMPTKAEAFSVQNAPEDPQEDSHESAHGKFFQCSWENVQESELGQFSHVLFSHVLFLGHLKKPRKLTNNPLLHPAAKGVRQKEFGKKN